MQLSLEQSNVHQAALQRAKNHKIAESQLIEILQRVEALNVHKSLGLRSLFQYATEILNLDEAIAYAMITVARKSLVVPELKAAITGEKLSVSKACRIVGVLDAGNARELVQFAEIHSKREIEVEVAKLRPKVRSRDKVKVLSKEWVELKVSISPETLQKLKRVESLLAQKGQPTSLDHVLDSALDAYLEKHDPVKKAERASSRQSLGPGRVKTPDAKLPIPYKRIPLTAAQKHAVFLRDQGKCTHTNLAGQRCNDDRWLDIHHIISVGNGGTNDLSNLTTLCSFHHDMVHQLVLPLNDGEVSWLRSPIVAYG